MFKRKEQLELRLAELEERIEMLEAKQNILLEATAKKPRGRRKKSDKTE